MTGPSGLQAAVLDGRDSVALVISELVDAISSRWNWSRYGRGKVVWALIDVP
jgi:hypothetical protein